MKKKLLFIWLFFVAMVAALAPKVEAAVAAETATTKITVHYKRTDNKYDGWDFYTWNYEPGGGEARAFNFTGSDSYGKIATVPLDEHFVGMKQMGFIVRRGGQAWLEKDIGSDRFLTIPETAPNGNFEIWLYTGLKNVFYSLEEAEDDKIVSSIFVNMKELRTRVIAPKTGTITKDKFHIYQDGEEMKDYNFSFSNGMIIASFDNWVPIDRAYSVTVDFNPTPRSTKASFAGIYETAQFVNNFTYEGDDLGVTFDKTKGTTTFKLWAPLATSVVLNIYNTGTPKSLGGTDTKVKMYYMTKQEKGVWAHTEPAIMHGAYYTYSVTNGGTTMETIDPYARSCGINGIRGMVVDFDQINEQVQFVKGVRPNQIQKPTDAIIYEIHVRDMTIDETWGGKKEWAGKYLGLTQEGTKYEGVTTGLDHMKELGITHVQIMPTYDYATVDETSSTGRNWGYDPLNYNCLEGSYSTNPYDGFNRIIEFKQMVKKLTEAGIAINMDVVYNHTARAINSNFQYIIPDYYHRMTSDGDFYNGSGCGNEIASQRPMVRKFILDSTKFWFTEYNLSGFRFDLMALVDSTTMGMVYDQLHEEYENVLVYGEPWDADGQGGSGRGYAQTTVRALSSINGVGVFNDHIRSSIRGGNEDTSGGFVQNGFSSVQDMNNKLLNSIKGYHPDQANLEPSRMINYAACHDNMTLWDKVTYSKSSASEAERIAINNQADSIVFFSQGIPFILCGQEFLRTKPWDAEEGLGRQVGNFNANSYNANDKTNAMKYDRKIKYNNVFEYYKGMISLRKAHNLFRLNSRTDLNNEDIFYARTVESKFIAYNISGENDINGTIYVLMNAGSDKTYSLGYASKKWAVVFDKDGLKEPGAAVTSVTVRKNETVVLVDTSSYNPDYSDGAYQGVGEIDWTYVAPPIGGGTNGKYNPNLDLTAAFEDIIDGAIRIIFNAKKVIENNEAPIGLYIFAIAISASAIAYIAARKRKENN